MSQQPQQPTTNQPPNQVKEKIYKGKSGVDYIGAIDQRDGTVIYRRFGSVKPGDAFIVRKETFDHFIESSGYQPDKEIDATPDALLRMPPKQSEVESTTTATSTETEETNS